MGKVFAVVSGKGGVGKSSVSIGLGFAFAKKGNRVLLVDMDEGLRCLDLMLGIDENTVFDLSDVLAGKDIDDAVYPCEFAENIFLIPAPSKTGVLDAFGFADFAKKTQEMFDVVIFDFPAGINLSLYSCLPKGTLFLTVAVPDPVSVRDAAAVSSVLSEMSIPARLIINRFIYKESGKYKLKNIDEIIDSSSLRLIGIVPETEEILMFSFKHRLRRKGKAFSAFMRITDRLSGQDRLLPKIKKI